MAIVITSEAAYTAASRNDWEGMGQGW
jgi:hypothetical protein